MEDNFIQKKRGRKPKNKNNNDLIDNNNLIDNVKDDIKKKRGRKPTGKIYEINKSLITNMSSGISNCIIAHLPLSEKDIAKIIGKEQDSKQEDIKGYKASSSKVTLSEDQYSDNLSDIIHSDSINIVQKPIPSHSSFVIEADDDIKHKYNEKCIELDNLKKKT